MKVILASMIAALAVISVCAQNKTAAKPSDKTDVSNIRKMDFSREKFDPKRDPKADLAEAVTKAGISNKRIILDIGGEWCVWCVYMDHFFVENPDLQKLRDDNFIWVKINMGPENENKDFLSAYPEISGYPHLFVLDQEGKLLESKNTSELEEGKGYNLTRFTEFLSKWAQGNH